MDTENTSPMALLIACGLVALAGGLLVAAAPLTMLLDKFLPDDVFYYLVPARNLAQTGFISFDGIHPTNGYQPLWFAVTVPFFWLWPAGGTTPFRAILLLQVVLSTITGLMMLRTLARLFGARQAAIGSVIWLALYLPHLTNGLETALYALMLALLFDRIARPADDLSARDYLTTGMLAGLTFLARTDAVFLIAALSCYLAFQPGAWSARRRAQHVKSLLLFAAPVAALAGTYVAINLLTTGHLMPVSGAVKAYYSELSRAAAIRESGSLWLAQLGSLLWGFRFPFPYHVMGAFGPWILFGMALRQPDAPASATIRRLWPFFAGATASYLFYALVYHGDYSQYPWYYAPHAFLAWLAVAGLSVYVDDYPPFDRLPGLSAGLLVSIAAGLLALPFWMVLLHGASLAALVWLIEQRRQQPGRAAVISLAAILLIVGQIVPYLSRRDQTATMAWMLVMMSVLYAEHGMRVAPRALAEGGLAFIACAALMQVATVRALYVGQPSLWGYNLYLGAMWARENLPPDAIIWAENSGSLGYFSGHQVVNGDGLMRDYAYLENVLRPGRRFEDAARWDYAIDAFPYPLGDVPGDGCLVPLPPEWQQHPFTSGQTVRVLQVIQMEPEGFVQCPTD